MPKKKDTLGRNEIFCLIIIVSTNILFVFRGQTMSMADTIAPWVMTIASLILASIIVFNEHIWNLINKRRIVYRVIICAGIGAVFCVPTYMYSHHIVVQQAEKQANANVTFGCLAPAPLK